MILQSKAAPTPHSQEPLTSRLLREIKFLSRYHGHPWQCSGWQSACQCRGHGFDPWSRKTPHATGHLSPCATIPEPVLHNKRSHSNTEAPAPQLRVQPPCTATRENPRGGNTDPVWPKANFFKIGLRLRTRT